MAKRVYGDYQWAGVPVTTTGKGNINNDGLEGYAELVGVLGADGLTLASGANPVPTSGSVTVTSETLAEATAAAPSYSEGQDAPLSQTLTGDLRTQAQGGAASGATAAGRPLPVGGDYTNPAPTVTTGQRVTWQFGTRGSGNMTLFSQNSTAAVTSLGVGSDATVSNTANPLDVGSFNKALNGTSWDRIRTIQGGDGTGLGVLATAVSPNSNVNAANAPSANTALAGSRTLKASAGNLYGLNLGSTTVAGYFLLVNATAAQSDGATAGLLKAWPVTTGQSLELSFDPPIRCTTGITLLFSSNTTTPFTTALSATAFISGEFV